MDLDHTTEGWAAAATAAAGRIKKRKKRNRARGEKIYFFSLFSSVEIGSQSSSRSGSGGGGHLHILMLARSIYIVGASRRPPAVPGPHSLHPSSSLQYAQWSSSSSVRLLFFSFFSLIFALFWVDRGGPPGPLSALSSLLFAFIRISGIFAPLFRKTNRRRGEGKTKEKKKEKRGSTGCGGGGRHPPDGFLYMTIFSLFPIIQYAHTSPAAIGGGEVGVVSTTRPNQK